MTRICVLGDGGWGTTLAIHLHQLGHEVSWWGAFADHVTEVNRRHENIPFLPGVPIPSNLHLTADLPEALEPATLVVVAIPSQHLRSVIQRVKALRVRGKTYLSVAKGIEVGTLKRMSSIIEEELGRVPVAALSGPNIAMEIAKGQPASSVVASRSPALAAKIQRLVMGRNLRVYTSADIIGVELGGALKNPLAIAAGIADGLGMQANTKAALITRGVVEMARLGGAAGAKEATFWGLSGLGDLVTTCLAGRNHWLGQQIGQGRTAREVLAGTRTVIEGVDTSRAAVALARRYRIEVPIIEQVHAILFKSRSPNQALQTLLQRRAKAEHTPSRRRH